MVDFSMLFGFFTRFLVVLYWSNNLWRLGIGHVCPLRGLQINSSSGEFLLQQGTDGYASNGIGIPPVGDNPTVGVGT